MAEVLSDELGSSAHINDADKISGKGILTKDINYTMVVSRSHHNHHTKFNV